MEGRWEGLPHYLQSRNTAEEKQQRWVQAWSSLINFQLLNCVHRLGGISTKKDGTWSGSALRQENCVYVCVHRNTVTCNVLSKDPGPSLTPPHKPSPVLLCHNGVSFWEWDISHPLFGVESLSLCPPSILEYLDIVYYSASAQLSGKHCHWTTFRTHMPILTLFHLLSCLPLPPQGIINFYYLLCILHRFLITIYVSMLYLSIKT